MIRSILVIVVSLIIGLFAIDHYYHCLLEDFIERYKSFVTGLSIISALGLIFTFYISFYQQHQSQKNKRSNLLSEIMVNVAICTNELQAHYLKYKEMEAMPVPESRFHIAIIEKSLSFGDITNMNANTLLWNCYRQMSVINSLFDQALLIRHTEHIADPRDRMLISGRRKKINSLISGSANILDELNPLLNKAVEYLTTKSITSVFSGIYSRLRRS